MWKTATWSGESGGTRARPRLGIHREPRQAVNRADLAQRAGGHPPPPGASPMLGVECAGVVKAVGEGVQRVKEGDEVCALLAGGGYAETVAVPAGQVLPKPSGLTFARPASIPEVFATAYLNLFMEAGMVRGENARFSTPARAVSARRRSRCARHSATRRSGPSGRTRR